MDQSHGEGFSWGQSGAWVQGNLSPVGWLGLGGRPHLNMPIRADGDGSLRESIFGAVPSFPFHSVLFTDFLSGPSTGKHHPSGLQGGCWKPLALPLLSALPCMGPLAAKGKIFSMIHKSLCVWCLPASRGSSPPSPHCSHMGPLPVLRTHQVQYSPRAFALAVFLHKSLFPSDTYPGCSLIS